MLAVVAAPGADVALERLANLVPAGAGDARARLFTARTATDCAPISRTCGTNEMQLGMSPHLLAGSAFSAAWERQLSVGSQRTEDCPARGHQSTADAEPRAILRKLDVLAKVILN